MASLLLGRDAGRAHAASHLLLLPEELPETVVLALVRARHPEVASTGDGGWRLGRWTTLRGPLLLDAAAAAGAGVPDPWRCAWVVECPVDRGDPPLPGTSDREGLHRAFPEGLPVMAERRALDLALALARRLEGAVRVAGGTRALLRPDPGSWVDRTVLSPHWLAPEEALAVVQRAVPDAELAVDGEQWQGLRPEAVALLEAVDLDDAPPADAREALHRAADARDAEVAAGDDVLDAYALAVELPGGGVVQLEVAGAGEAPPVLGAVPWAGQAVTYRAVWWPADPAAAEHEVPPPDVRAERAEAAVVVEAMATVLLATVDGVTVDADGFPLA